jgi:hypothetical protein
MGWAMLAVRVTEWLRNVWVWLWVVGDDVDSRRAFLERLRAEVG